MEKVRLSGRLDAPTAKGLHRVAWDLRHPYYGSVETPPNWQGLLPSGFMVNPTLTTPPNSL